MSAPSERFNYGIMSTERTVNIPNFSKICDLRLSVKFHTSDFTFQQQQPETFKREKHLFNCCISLKKIKEKEWISVSFSLGTGGELQRLHYYNLSCTLHLKNVDGLLKFPLSFAVDGMGISQFISNRSKEHTDTIEFEVMENYLSKKKLLNDSTELLPEDTLALHFEICIDYCQVGIVNDSGSAPSIIMQRWALKQGYFIYFSENGMKLNINSAIYPSLCKESTFFQGLDGSGMREEQEGWMNIPSSEVEHFAEMLYFIEYGTLHYVNYGEKAPTLAPSLEEATLSLYIIADKYGVPKLQSFCRDLLMQYTLSEKNAENVHIVADLCDDQILKNYSSRYIPKLTPAREDSSHLDLPPLIEYLVSFSRRHHQFEFDFYS